MHPFDEKPVARSAGQPRDDPRVVALEEALARARVATASRNAEIQRLRLELDQRDQELRELRRKRQGPWDPPPHLAVGGGAPSPLLAWILGALRGFAPRREATANAKITSALRRRVAESGLFDPGWYLAHHLDVARSGMDPLEHYLRHGAAEGRDPGPRFCTSFYLRTYSDVAARGVNPLLDHLERGARAGRRTAPDAHSGH